MLRQDHRAGGSLGRARPSVRAVRPSPFAPSQPRPAGSLPTIPPFHEPWMTGVVTRLALPRTAPVPGRSHARQGGIIGTFQPSSGSGRCCARDGHTPERGSWLVSSSHRNRQLPMNRGPSDRWNDRTTLRLAAIPPLPKGEGRGEGEQAPAMFINVPPPRFMGAMRKFLIRGILSPRADLSRRPVRRSLLGEGGSGAGGRILFPLTFPS